MKTNNLNQSYYKLKSWLDQNGFESYDLSDIRTTRFFIWITSLSYKHFFFKKVAAILIIVADKNRKLLRRVFNIKKKNYPQALALIARAYFAEYKFNKNDSTLKKGLNALDWLIKNRSPGYKRYCWGQPYNWVIRKKIPAFTPRATVTSQVAQALIDAYEITDEKEYIEIAKDICNFYLEGLNWKEDKDGDICFSYTSEDNYHIHNANMVVAAVLFRTWMHTKIEKFKTHGFKAIQFTMKHQNQDGSWYYWASPDKIIGKIDHYHTGFVLEAFEEIKTYLGEEFPADQQLENGIEYYLEHLFENNILPKFTNNKKFPIDIQSCAQAIITFGEIQKRKPEFRGES